MNRLPGRAPDAVAIKIRQRQRLGEGIERQVERGRG
jgi:hypothetical protein